MFWLLLMVSLIGSLPLCVVCVDWSGLTCSRIPNLDGGSAPLREPRRQAGGRAHLHGRDGGAEEGVDA